MLYAAIMFFIIRSIIRCPSLCIVDICIRDIYIYYIISADKSVYISYNNTNRPLPIIIEPSVRRR